MNCLETNIRAMKESKIGIKFMLNQSISVDFEDSDKNANDRINAAPIYAQVTYMRKNTKFRIGNDTYLDSDLRKPKIKRYFANAEAMITSIIRKEHRLYGENFSLKGLGVRFEKYQENIFNGLSTVIVNGISDFYNTLSDKTNKTDNETMLSYLSMGIYMSYGFCKTKEQKSDLIKVLGLSKKLLSTDSIELKTIQETQYNIELLETIYCNDRNFNIIFGQTIYSLLIEEKIVHPEINTKTLRTTLLKYINS